MTPPVIVFISLTVRTSPTARHNPIAQAIVNSNSQFKGRCRSLRQRFVNL